MQVLEAFSGLAVNSAPVSAERVLDGAMALLLGPCTWLLLCLFNMLSLGTSLMAQVVKNLPPMQEKDPLEKGLAIHSSILAWRIPWIEESGGLPSLGSQRVGHDWAQHSTPLLNLILLGKPRIVSCSAPRLILTLRLCPQHPGRMRRVDFALRGHVPSENTVYLLILP